MLMMNINVESTISHSINYQQQELHVSKDNSEIHLQNYQVNASQTKILNIQSKKKRQHYISTKGGRVLTASDVR